MKIVSFANFAVTDALSLKHTCNVDTTCTAGDPHRILYCSLVPNNPLKATRILYSARTDSVWWIPGYGDVVCSGRR